jgi:hypothetical protein
MAELKTQKNNQDVVKFLEKVEPEQKREDSFKLLGLMKKVTKSEPSMWGDSIIGFGDYHYKYASGREADWFAAGFSPRKQNLTLYLMSGFGGYEEVLSRLGKHSTGKGCLYIKKLDDIDLDTLEELVRKSVDQAKQTNPSA